MSKMSFRSFTVAAVMASAAASASALTIPTDFVQADSFQNFSEDALTQYELFEITVTPGQCLGHSHCWFVQPARYQHHHQLQLEDRLGRGYRLCPGNCSFLSWRQGWRDHRQL